MSIKDQLTEDMKQAMKDREAGKLRLSVIRMVRANIKNVEINEKKELNDDEVLAILLKEVKMRQDSLVEFEKAERSELAEQAKAGNYDVVLAKGVVLYGGTDITEAVKKAVK